MPVGKKRYLRKNRGPWNASTGRDYDKEKKFNDTPEAKKDRAARGRARYKMEKEGKVKKGQDVAHKNSKPSDNDISNLKAESPSKNRGKKGKGEGGRTSAKNKNKGKRKK